MENKGKGLLSYVASVGTNEAGGGGANSRKHTAAKAALTRSASDDELSHHCGDPGCCAAAATPDCVYKSRSDCKRCRCYVSAASCGGNSCSIFSVFQRQKLLFFFFSFFKPLISRNGTFQPRSL